jgi:hypothetical protein
MNRRTAVFERTQRSSAARGSHRASSWLTKLLAAGLGTGILAAGSGCRPGRIPPTTGQAPSAASRPDVRRAAAPSHGPSREIAHGTGWAFWLSIEGGRVYWARAERNEQVVISYAEKPEFRAHELARGHSLRGPVVVEGELLAIEPPCHALRLTSFVDASVTLSSDELTCISADAWAGNLFVGGRRGQQYVVRRGPLSSQASILEMNVPDPPTKILVDARWVYVASDLSVYRLDAEARTAADVNATRIYDIAGGSLLMAQNERYLVIGDGSKLVRVAKEDLHIATITDTQYQGGLAVSGDIVYWTEPRSGRVMASALSEARPFVIAEGQARPTRVAASAKILVWTNDRSVEGREAEFDVRVVEKY